MKSTVADWLFQIQLYASLITHKTSATNHYDFSLLETSKKAEFNIQITMKAKVFFLVQPPKLCSHNISIRLFPFDSLQKIKLKHFTKIQFGLICSLSFFFHCFYCSFELMIEKIKTSHINLFFFFTVRNEFLIWIFHFKLLSLKNIVQFIYKFSFDYYTYYKIKKIDSLWVNTHFDNKHWFTLYKFGKLYSSIFKLNSIVI